MLTRWDLNELRHEDDELMHYGVKGMRWGKHLPGVDILNAAVAKARAGVTNLRNELNGTNAYNRGIADAKRRNKNLDATIAYTKKQDTISVSQDRAKQAAISKYKANKAQNMAEATSIGARRAAYDNSIEGRIKKFANNTLKSLRYNAGQAQKSISSTLSSFGKKALSSIKSATNSARISVVGLKSKAKNFTKGATSSTMNPFKYVTDSSYRSGYKAGNAVNKLRRRAGIYTSSEKSSIRKMNPRNRYLSTKR